MAESDWAKLKRTRGLSDWEALKLVLGEYAKEKIGELAGAISAPGDAFSGRMDPLSPEGMARVGALSGLLTPGPLATGPAHIAPGALSAAGWHKGLINDLEALVAKPQAKPKAKEASPMADLYASLAKLDSALQAQGMPKPTPPAKPPQIQPAKEWVKTGPAKGSNPGGTYNDPSGVPHYVKFYKDDAQARSEWLAGKTLDALGIKHLNPEVKAVDGKLGVASKWNENLEPLSKSDFEKLTPKQEDQLAKMYLGAALTKNWDVVGLGFDNIMRDKKTGDLVQVDLGGSFKHRAQGEAKPYGKDVDELHSLLDPKYPVGQVFSKVFEKNPESLIKAKEALQKAAPAIEALLPQFKSNGAEDIHQTMAHRFDAINHELDPQGAIELTKKMEESKKALSSKPEGLDKVETKAPDSPPNLEQIKKDLGLTGDVGYFHPHGAEASEHPAGFSENLPRKAQNFTYELLEMKKQNPEYGWEEHFDNLTPFIEAEDMPHLAAATNHLNAFEEKHGPIQFEQEKYVHPFAETAKGLSAHPAMQEILKEKSPIKTGQAASLYSMVEKGEAKSASDALAQLHWDGLLTSDEVHASVPVAQQLDKWAAQHGGWNFELKPEVKPEFGPKKPAKGSSTTKAVEKGLTPFEWQLLAPEQITPAPPELAALLSDPQRVERALDLGHNLTIPLFGGKHNFQGQAIDPKFWEYEDEKAFFLAGHDPFAKLIALNEYANGNPDLVHTFTSNAKNPLMLDWIDTFGDQYYAGHKMAKAIDIARERGADMLMLKRMSDLGSSEHGLQTQFAILDPKIVRWPSAEYNPLMVDSPNLLHAGGLPIPLFPQWEPEDAEGASRRIINIAR